MRIDINLASQPYEDARRFWIYWGTGLGLLGALTILLGFLAITGFINGSRDRQQISKLEAQLTAYDQEKGRAEALLNQPQNRVIRDRSRFLNSLFQRKAFSWTRVFEDLERVMPAHLHVVSIHPDMSSDNNLELKLVVGGETREQALDLVRKMEGSNRFRQTHIESDRTESLQSAEGDRVQFNIVAVYVQTDQAPEASGGMH